MEKIILNLTGYQIAFIILWLLIALYTDWRVYKTNKHFLSTLDEKEKNFLQSVDSDYTVNFIKNCVVITLPIIKYGFVVLSHKRSIHNGELLK